MIHVTPPVDGYDLKLQVLTQTIVWELYATDEAKEVGGLFIEEDQLEFAEKVAGKVLAALDNFKEE